MEIRAFPGWRYYGGSSNDVSAYVAPPYDVLSERDKQSLLERSDKNIVAVDLPHFPLFDAGPDEVYGEAAKRLDDWKATGVLIQDERPALYAYEQSFSWGGKHYTRRAMLCGVRVTELGKDVIPHESIFPGPKADRLKLTQHTRMQLSPILGFFHDPGGQVMDILFATDRRCDVRNKLRDVSGQMWVVTNEGVISEIASIVRDTPVFIADGHHRYATALTYRDQLREVGQLENGHESNYAFFALVARDDPALLVLPTHRIVNGLKEGFSVERLARKASEFTWNRCSVEGADLKHPDAFLRRYGRGAMGFIDRDPAEIWIAKLSDETAMERVAPEMGEVWRDLDVAKLHKLIIDGALVDWRTEDLFIEYTPDGPAVLAACNSGRAQLGICLQGTPIDAVETVASAGMSMPHKSTYFHPKPATGMVLKPLE